MISRRSLFASLLALPGIRMLGKGKTPPYVTLLLPIGNGLAAYIPKARLLTAEETRAAEGQPSEPITIRIHRDDDWLETETDLRTNAERLLRRDA